MERFIKAGKILRPVGLKGRVLVMANSSPEHILEPGSFYIKSPSGRYEEFFIQNASRKRQRQIVCQLKWVDSLEKAQRLCRLEVYQKISRLPRTAEDEFYWFELEGLEVIDTYGKPLGRIHSVIETGASDVLVVRDEKREILLPMVEDVIKRVDTEKGMCMVELTPGLLEATSTSLKSGKR